MSFLTNYEDIRAGIAEAYFYLENYMNRGENPDYNSVLEKLQGYLNCADGWHEEVDAALAECKANNGSDDGKLGRLKCEIEGLQYKLINEIAVVSKKKSDMENTNCVDEFIEAENTNCVDEFIEAENTNCVDEFIEAENTNSVDDFIEAENTNRVDDYIEAENTNRVDDFI